MKFKQFIISLMAIILGLIAGAILMAIMGHNPIDGYSFLFKRWTYEHRRIGNTLATATPLILTGLSLAFAFKTGLFNIGAQDKCLWVDFCYSSRINSEITSSSLNTINDSCWYSWRSYMGIYSWCFKKLSLMFMRLFQQ